VASARVWWIVGGIRQPIVQLTTDGGNHWRTVVAQGLPSRSCAIIGVSAATARDAWIVARVGHENDTALFQTHDGGHTWVRVPLLRK